MSTLVTYILSIVLEFFSPSAEYVEETNSFFLEECFEIGPVFQETTIPNDTLIIC